MITKNFRFTNLALIFSIALNVVALVSFAFFSLQTPVSVATKLAKKEVVTTNGQIFASMSRLSFRELVSFLTNRDLIEEGYSKRDLAVAALTAYHHFNLEKALSVMPVQVRTLVLSGGQTIDLFPGLTDEQFDAIIRFAYQEKWPLTSKGLYAQLQNQKSPREESLEQAFFLTPEFYSLKLLFQKTKVPQDPQILLSLALEGSWPLLERLFDTQSADFSEEMRRSFLLGALSNHSTTAARILLKTDFTFALKKLEDKALLDILSLLKQQSAESTKFCVELLRAPRSDAIWQAAAMTLYAYVGEMPTLPLDTKSALARFSATPTQAAPVQELKLPTQSRFHTVMEGESLWKISRRYDVKVEEIVQINGLENTSLFPGMTLKLP